MKKIVIALGGNALGKSPVEQLNIVKKTAKSILNLYEQKNKILVVHGNGPQVGMINNAFTEQKEIMPFPECGAMSQGYIGYHIQNAIKNEAIKRNIDVNVVSLITQTLVNESDSAFTNPSKPIGTFLSKTDADKISNEKGWIFKEDSGRGWRRVVPSPKPVNIIEEELIKQLLEKDNNIIIAGGGGGIPVINKNNKLQGVDAVIDKDLTASKMASIINADIFMILTAVDKILLNYGKPDETPINEISSKELENYYEQNIFAEGSMKPKVKAVLNFVKSTKNDAYIADLSLVEDVISRKSGTKIYN